MKRKSTFFIIIVCITTIFVMFVGCGGDSGEIGIKITGSSSSYEKENYQDVISELERLGFTDIKTERLEDLITGWLTKDGSVNQISINGNTYFSAGSLFPKDAEIIITYHTFPKKAEITYSLDTNAEFFSLSFKVDRSWLHKSEVNSDIYYFEGAGANDYSGDISLVYLGITEKNTLSVSDMEYWKQQIISHGDSVSFFGEPEKMEVAGKEAWLLKYEEIYSNESEGVTGKQMYVESLFFIDNDQTLYVIWVFVPIDRTDEYKDLLRDFVKIVTMQAQKIADDGSRVIIDNAIGKLAYDINKELVEFGYSVSYKHAHTKADFTYQVQTHAPDDQDWYIPWLITGVDSYNEASKNVSFFIDNQENMDRLQSQRAAENALRDKLDVFDAWEAVVRYGNRDSPNGFRVPPGGRFPPVVRDANTWFLKGDVEVRNDLNRWVKIGTVEALVSGTTASPRIDSFIIYY